MSILKKTLGRLSGLVGQSSTETKSAGSEKKSPLPVRPPRVKVLPLHNIEFKSSIKGLDNVHLLSNISVGGMALILPEDSKGPLSELTIYGELSIDGQDYYLEAEIRHIIPGFLGCQFLSPSDDMTEAIQSYLKHELLGVQLNRVSPKYIKKDARGEVFWYSDGGSNELYFVAGATDVFEFHMSFLGHYVESDSHGGIRYGMLLPDRSSSMGIKRANMLTLTDEVPNYALQAAHTVMNNIDGLGDNERMLLQNLLVF